MPLGIRNNNPGNIRPSEKYTWAGAVGVNKGFVVFESIEYGLRALAMDLINKQLRGLDTVRRIIDTYAPPSENDTDAYIKAVATKLRYGPDWKIPLAKEVILTMIVAITEHENGSAVKTIIDRDLIETALQMIPDSLKDKIGMN